MEIKILHDVDGAKKSTGLVVVIDVFRAFSTACYVAQNGAEKIIPVGDIDEAYMLKKNHPDYILMGERDGYIQPGFDFGNSPSQIAGKDFSAKTVVLTTTAGTQGIANAKNAGELITASFVNAAAVASYVKRSNCKVVSLVCTEKRSSDFKNEDELCAEYIRNLLTGIKNDFQAVVSYIKKHHIADHFFDPKVTSHPPEDYELCMDLDRFDFVLKANHLENGYLALIKTLLGRKN